MADPDSTGTDARARVLRFVEKTDTCWLWQGGMSSCGYGRAYPDGTHKSGDGAHRVFYRLFMGPIPDGKWVLHRCDVKRCVRPDHLYIGDSAQNIRDAVERGRVANGERNAMRRHPERSSLHGSLIPRPKGEAHWKAKHTAEEIVELRRQAALGVSSRELARRYGYGSCAAITGIVRRKSWKHI